ncbi:MAG TPA: DUF1629 domain-containing protein [Anaeromyxobacter sp.]
MDFYQIELMPTDNPDFVFIDNPPEGTSADAFQMAEGERMAADYPRDARIYLTDESPGLVLPSLIGNTRSLLIVVKAIKEVLESAGGDVEYLPFTLYNHKKRVASRDYFIVNPIGTFDCIDFKKSKIKYSKASPNVILKIEKLVLDAKKLEKAPDFFRIDRQPSRYVVSDRLGKKIAALKPTNVFIHKLDQA